MIDFHCHIDLYAEPTAVLDGAVERGVHILAVTTTPKAWNGTRKLVAGRPRIRVGLGLHPELVAERHGEVALFEHHLPSARYVGEIGLDGSPHHRGSYALQDATLSRILKACAAAGGRVMSLHSRRAATGVLDALAAYPAAGTPVLHWFSGTMKELDRAVQQGCWFSVGPSMLASAKGRALVEAMPRDRMLTETDAPFAQVNGSPLMPWDVVRAYPALATIWGCDEAAARDLVSSNLRSLAGRDNNTGPADAIQHRGRQDLD